MIANMGLKRSAEDLSARLSPIARALDLMQRDTTGIGDAVEMSRCMEAVGERACWPESVRRLEKVLQGKVWQCGYRGTSVGQPAPSKVEREGLTNQEKETATEYANEKWPFLTPIVMRFQGQSSPFTPYVFSEEVTHSVTALEWWLSFSGVLDEEVPDAVAHRCCLLRRCGKSVQFIWTYALQTP